MCRYSLEGLCFASNAAEALKLDANELLKLGIVDRILNEPLGVPIVIGIKPQPRSKILWLMS